MSFVKSTFDRVGDLYAGWFADWLHMHFIIRTVMILFVLWLLIFLLAKLIHYVIAPVSLLIFYHVIFRVWNFLVVETLHEWLYIRYHSKDMPNFSGLYLRLCDKVKHNRYVLLHTKYKGLVIRSKRFVIQFVVVSAVAATLWASAFGLHHEYSVPVAVLTSEEENESEAGIYISEEIPEYYEEVFYLPTENNIVSPVDLEDGAVLTLNEEGRQGARLRDGAGIAGQIVIEIVWEDDVLIYLNEYVQDVYVNGLFWLKVKSPSGTVGYIGSQLIE